MECQGSERGGVTAPPAALAAAGGRDGPVLRSRAPILTGAAAGVLAWLAVLGIDRGEGQAPLNSPPEVVVHVSDLPRSALHEFEFWSEPASPGGRMVGTPNTGDDLDPPPEDDPHVRFTARVHRGVPYRCWIHMKVGRPKGRSQANRLYVQFTDAVDRAQREVLRPGTGSFLTAQGPAREGWAWVGCEAGGPGSAASLVHFKTGGEVTVRVQAGMEGVGFDQVLLSPARYLEKAPAEAVVPKPAR